VPQSRSTNSIVPRTIKWKWRESLCPSRKDAQTREPYHATTPHPAEPIEDIYEPNAGINLGAIPTRGPELTVQNDV